MTDVRTFKAATMQEALKIVREEMGPDAVILHTRSLPKPKLLRWMRSQETVEITAGLGVNIRPPAARIIPRPAPVAAAATRQSPSSAQSETRAVPPLGKRAPQTRLQNEDLAPPPSLLGAQPQNSRNISRETADPSSSRQHAPRAEPAREYAPIKPAPIRPASSNLEARSFAPTSPAVPAARPSLMPERSQDLLREALADSSGASLSTAEISQQLHSIRQIVEQLSRRGNANRAEEIPADLFQLFAKLIDAEVEEDVARELIFRLKEECRPEQLHDVAESMRHLTSMVERDIRCAPPISVVPGKRKVVALVGPTGVGKTTTIAKLAANFRLRDGVRMGLVTVDTYRIAAVEQLRTYAEIIDLPMKVVTSPREMRRALDELAGLDLILIDTAGRSPRDELKIQELKTLLAEAQVDEVHLVLSLVASARSLEATAEKFAVANTTSMILTKLDEAPAIGTLLSLSKRVNLPISYVTTGQNVPDDIEPAEARRLTRLVLGEDNVFSRQRH